MRVLWVFLLAAVGAAPFVHAAPPHIVHISIDTLRADHQAAYGYGHPQRVRTPEEVKKLKSLGYIQ